MAQLPRLHFTRERRKRVGVFAGATGIASLLAVGLPLWTPPAGAVPVGDFGPSIGVPGTAIIFRITSGCVNVPEFPGADVAVQIVTDADETVDNHLTSPPEIQAFEFQADGIYGDDFNPQTGFDRPYLAPPEIDRAEGDTSAGPAYPFVVGCFEEQPASGTPEDIEAAFGAAVYGNFIYARGTSSTSSSSTSSSSSTTSTTTGSSTTTTTTTPASTTSTTTDGGSTTTTTTGGGSTTTTTVGATTSTTGAITTSTTSGGGTTSTTASGGTTTSTASGATTTSTTSGGTTSTTTTGGTTSTTASGGTTTSTAAGATTSSTAGGGTTSSIPSGSSTTSTVATACTASDTTPVAASTISVSCPGFAPGSSVTVQLFSTPVTLGTFTASSAGVASGSVQIPLDTSAGTHEIRMTGTAPGGAAVVKSIPIDVERVLPRTGGESWTQLRMSLLLVGIGLLMLGRSQIIAIRA